MIIFCFHSTKIIFGSRCLCTRSNVFFFGRDLSLSVRRCLLTRRDWWVSWTTPTTKTRKEKTRTTTWLHESVRVWARKNAPRDPTVPKSPRFRGARGLGHDPNSPASAQPSDTSTRAAVPRRGHATPLRFLSFPSWSGRAELYEQECRTSSSRLELLFFFSFFLPLFHQRAVQPSRTSYLEIEDWLAEPTDVVGSREQD